MTGLSSINPSSSIHYHHRHHHQHHHHHHYFLHSFFFYTLSSIYWFTLIIWGVMTSKRPWKPVSFSIFSKCTRAFSVFLCSPVDEINVGMAGGKGMCFTSQFDSLDDRSVFLFVCLFVFLLMLSVPFQSNLIRSCLSVKLLTVNVFPLTLNSTFAYTAMTISYFFFPNFEKGSTAMTISC